MATVTLAVEVSPEPRTGTACGAPTSASSGSAVVIVASPERRKRVVEAAAGAAPSFRVVSVRTMDSPTVPSAGGSEAAVTRRSAFSRSTVVVEARQLFVSSVSETRLVASAQAPR